MNDGKGLTPLDARQGEFVVKTGMDEMEAVDLRVGKDRRVATDKEQMYYALNTNGPLRRYQTRRTVVTTPTANPQESPAPTTDAGPTDSTATRPSRGNSPEIPDSSIG